MASASQRKDGGAGMSSTQIAALIGVLGFVVSGVNLVWILRKELRTRRSIRTMIDIEIEDNLARLQEFWSRADVASTVSNTQLANMQKNDALRMGPLPILGHGTWQTLAASVPVALRPEEIRRVHRFHAKLDEIAQRKEHHDGPLTEQAAYL